MRFLHISDLHLDAPHPMAEADITPGEYAKEALSSLILYAKQNAIRLVLISGDLFDCAYLTRETEHFLVRLFASIPECHFVIAPGNRDYYRDGCAYAYLSFSDNVHIFSSATPTCFPLDELGVQVWGFAHTSPDMRGAAVLSGLELAPKTKGVYRIFCGHCAMESGGAVVGEDSYVESGKIPTVTKEALARCGFDYAALGYAHTADGIRRISYAGGVTYYGYAGALVGRGYDECGFCGAVLGDIQTDAANKTTLSIRRLRLVRHHYEALNVSFGEDVQSYEDAYCVINDAVSAAVASGVSLDGDTSLLITLWGILPPTVYISKARLQAILPQVASMRVQDETTLSSDIVLSSDTTLRGAYYRALYTSREDTEDDAAVAERALTLGFEALTEHTRGE